MVRMVDTQYIFKILLLGSSRTGKTSLINKLIYQKFSEKYIPTTPVQIESFPMQYAGNSFLFSIWELGSQLSYKSLIEMYLRGTSVVIFLIDLTNFVSLNAVNDWLPQVEKHCGSPILVFLVNKIDLTNEADFSISDVKSLMEKISKTWSNEIFLYEYSIKNDDNLIEIFENLGQLLSTSSELEEEFESEII